MTIIEKIRNEIERLKELHKTPTFKGDEYEEGGVNGYQLALDKLLSFLSTLESEKPIEGLEEEIKSWIPPIKVKVDEDVRGIMKHIREWGELIARHFAEWGYLRAAEKYNEVEYNRQRAEESVPNDLDFEQELYNHFGQVKDFTLGMRIAKYFYELGSSEKSNNHEGLDEAAEGIYKTRFYTRADDFKAGAEWAFSRFEKVALSDDLYIKK